MKTLSEILASIYRSPLSVPEVIVDLGNRIEDFARTEGVNPIDLAGDLDRLRKALENFGCGSATLHLTVQVKDCSWVGQEGIRGQLIRLRAAGFTRHNGFGQFLGWDLSENVETRLEDGFGFVPSVERRRS